MGNVSCCQNLNKKKKKEIQKEVRSVQVGKKNSPKYPFNRVITSKYTLWNFLPKNLFQQFRRIANFYFLSISLISFIIENPIGPFTTLIPLSLVVFVTAIKQGYEDYIRHRADKLMNDAEVWVLKNQCLQKIPSKKIKVGDIIKVCENEDVPCDIVLLMTSHEGSKCYVTTSSLDGETSLKTFYCPKSLKWNITTEDLRHLEANIECEDPTPDLYKFNGRIEFSKDTSNLLKRNSIKRKQSLQVERCKGTENLDNVGLDQPRARNEYFVNNGFSINGSGRRSRNFVLRDKKGPSLGGKGKLLRNTVQNLAGLEGDDLLDGNLSDTRSSAMLLSTFKCSSFSPPKNMTLPKNALTKHKKSFSNVTNLSLDPAFVESLELMKKSFKRRGSNQENLIDPLTSENLLLKGSTLKNTEFVYGCAVYTGQETKMSLNSKLARNKFSVAEKSINKFLMLQLSLLIAESVVSTIMNATIEIKSGTTKFRTMYVMDEEEKGKRGTFASLAKDIFLFTMLYNYLLPISLYVTLEMTKFLGTLLFKWDLKMYDEESSRAALSNTSDLNEELGEVEYLFTDKTGTLTENNLRFRTCSIDGVTYQEKDGCLYRMNCEGDLTDSLLTFDFNSPPTKTELFLLALTLCNTIQVIVENDEEPFRYSSTSPDEKALVEAMQRMGIEFANDDDFVVINVNGNNRIFQKLEVLEFSSSRKRMSVIVKDEHGNIRLYCKGAESAVLPKVLRGPIDETFRNVSSFAKKGLRTLVIGYKDLTENEFNMIEEKVQKARETLSSDREDILLRTYEAIECKLTLLGATGVEDQLQEGVEDTLESIRAAGIKVWMLTGDKEETAVQISLSCGHFRSEMKRITLTKIGTKHDCEKALHSFLSKVRSGETKDYGLVVDGASLHQALNHCQDLFRDVCMESAAVVCCRLSPIQKSDVVRMLKSKKGAPVVAAIGDGANDVSMIKEAHVGFGIMGKEGRQAVLCSDFAFAKFRFLKQALLVHGHWYYVRTANLVQYFFYKNIVFITPQFYFFFLSGYSVQQLYESLFYVFYNTLFTSLPILLYGVFEQNYPARRLIDSPKLYKRNRRNALMTWKYFCLWLAQGVWHSLVIFFVPALFYQSSISGIAEGFLDQYGTIIFHNSVIIVNLKLLLHSRFWSFFFVISIILSIVGLFLVTIVYSSIFLPNINYNYYWTFNRVIQNPNYWLLCVLSCVLALLPDILIQVFHNADAKFSK